MAPCNRACAIASGISRRSRRYRSVSKTDNAGDANARYAALRVEGQRHESMLQGPGEHHNCDRRTRTPAKNLESGQQVTPVAAWTVWKTSHAAILSKWPVPVFLETPLFTTMAARSIQVNGTIALVGADNRVMVADQRVYGDLTVTVQGQTSMIASCGLRTCLLDDCSRPELAGAARTLRCREGHRDPGAASRGCRAAPKQPLVFRSFC